MNLSIIIPAYNEEKYLGQLLKSLFENAPADLHQVIVVDNACSDRTVEIAAGFPKVTIVHEQQKGLTKARQAGLKAATGDLLAYLDADTILSNAWFKILEDEFKSDADLVCLSGPYHYYDLPLHHNFFVRIWNNSWLKIWHWCIDGIMVMETGYVIMGGNFVAKKAALLSAGGFNPEIAFYGEDTDIAEGSIKLGK